MTWPENFDQNELIILIGLIASFSVVLWLPKRFPLSFSILICMFAATVARLSDHLISGLIVDLYKIMDSSKYELFDLLSYVYYGPFAYLFVYFYDKYKISGWWTVLYIMVSSILGTIFESIHAYMDVFQYNGWQLLYSFTFYLFIQPVTLLFYHFVKNLYAKHKNEMGIYKGK